MDNMNISHWQDTVAPNVSGSPKTDNGTHEDLTFYSSKWMIFISAAFMISSLGIFGNLMVISVIWKNPRLHTVQNTLLINLAITDLTVLLICPAFIAYVTSTGWSPDILGEWGCKIIYYVLHVSVYVSIYILVVIASIRYLAIIHTNKSMLFKTRKAMWIVVTCLWCFMLCANTPILFAYSLSPWNGFLVCLADDDSGWKICITFMIFAYALPLAIITVLSVFTHVGIANYGSKLIRNELGSHRRHYASRLLAAVVIAFAILWLPLHIDQLLVFFDPSPFSNEYEIVRVFFFILPFCNSAINPIIYNFTSKTFRTAFRKFLCSIFFVKSTER